MEQALWFAILLTATPSLMLGFFWAASVGVWLSGEAARAKVEPVAYCFPAACTLLLTIYLSVYGWPADLGWMQ